MKTKHVLAAVALAVAALVRAEAPKEPAHIVPAEFESRATAVKYVSKLSAGGAVDMLKVGNKDVLVVYIYGSGVPDIAIAAYRLSQNRWILAAEIDGALGGIHKAVVSDGAIILVGSKTEERLVLLEAEKQSANKAPEPTTPSVTPAAAHRSRRLPSWLTCSVRQKYMSALTEPEFKATMKEPMVDVTAAPGDIIDIWPYVAAVAAEVGLPALVVEKELIEQVYRSDDGIYDHVLLPTEKKNKYIVVVVDRARSSVAGHRILDLNREYGIE